MHITGRKVRKQVDQRLQKFYLSVVFTDMGHSQRALKRRHETATDALEYADRLHDRYLRLQAAVKEPQP
jgi:hypothetical protein